MSVENSWLRSVSEKYNKDITHEKLLPKRESQPVTRGSQKGYQKRALERCHKTFRGKLSKNNYSKMAKGVVPKTVLKLFTDNVTHYGKICFHRIISQRSVSERCQKRLSHESVTPFYHGWYHIRFPDGPFRKAYIRICYAKVLHENICQHISHSYHVK